MEPEYERLSFGDWTRRIFDWPEGEEPWYHDIKVRGPMPPPADSLAFVTLLFRESAAALARFTDLQAYRGLTYIINPGFSAEFITVQDPRLPLADRIRGVEAVFDLYRDLFAARCGQYLSHRDESRENPLNMVCYMFWDAGPLPTINAKAEPELAAAALSAMERTLALPHEACREGALHGLGHSKYYCPAEVERIIEGFLAAGGGLRPELRDYARAAGTGMIQ